VDKKSDSYWIFQHPKEVPGSWNRAMIVAKCPYEPSRYVTAYFNKGKDFVHDYTNSKFWLTQDQVNELVKRAQANGLVQISNEYASKYGL
jgi:hypothetical protein